MIGDGANEVYIPGDHAVWLLKRAFHSAYKAVNDAIREYNVTPTQIGALNRLIREPGMSGAELARRLLVTPQAAQLALSALEARGFVEKTPDPNHGRIVRATVTKEGRRVIRACMKKALVAEEELLSVLNEDERRLFNEFLFRLASNSKSD